VVALAQELRREPGGGGGGGAPALPPAWLCARVLGPLARALDGPDWPARRAPQAPRAGVHRMGALRLGGASRLAWPS